jgi:hypothetical protein
VPAQWSQDVNDLAEIQSSIELSDLPDELPDMYYIILDAYGRQDRIEELYGYSNQPFVEALEERGFWVGDKTRSNYHYTRRSLPSSLNMIHLNEMDASKFATRTLSHQMINQGEVIKTLNQAGYETIALADGFPPIENASFNRYLTESYATSELDSALLGSTWILPLMEAARRTSPFDSSRQRLLRRFDVLGDLADEATDPMFVFAHILSPHRPFLFDAEGQHVGYPESFWDGASYYDPKPETRDMYIRGYVGQLQFVNQRVLELIDKIKARDRESIIILQGDHGPGGYMHDEASHLKHLRERFSILMAIDGPPSMNDALYDSMTPVNLFRIVFNDALGTDLELLEDRSYFEDDRERKTLVEVTQQLADNPGSLKHTQDGGEP